MMEFYASKCHDMLNKAPFTPEKYALGVMVNPNYPNVTIPAGTRYIIDSGAFQDVATESRLSFSGALARQLDFEKQLGTPAYAIVSYDRLIDEQVEDGKQVKRRVNEETGAQFVEETIQAAEYLKGQNIPNKKILSCQGVTVRQYLDCIGSVLGVAGEDDILGIGGFCILSKSKKYRQDYYAILSQALPLIQAKGLKRIHIFGMSVFEVLIHTEIMASQYGITCSYDTSSAELNSVFGRVFNPTIPRLQGVFDKTEKYNTYSPARLSHLNISNITNFWDNFENIGIKGAE